MVRILFLIFFLVTTSYSLADCSERSPKQLQQELSTLYQEIQRHNQLYDAGTPVISDDAYDSLVEQKRTLTQCLTTKKLIEKPEAPPPDSRHQFPMGSLKKARSKEDISKFLQLAKAHGGEVILQPKIDGIALELVYERGFLVQALTRGQWRNGSGIDLLHVVINIPTIPKVIPGHSPKVVIHGELYADPKNDNIQQSVSPRHYVAGLINRHSPPREELSKLLFFPWYWASSTSSSFREDSTKLTEMGFKTTSSQTHKVQSLNDITALLHNYKLQHKKKQLPLDGIVLKIDSKAIQNRLGHNSGTPRWALAWKFPPQTTTSKVKDIRWTIGRTGQITILLDITPVHLDGIKIQTINAGPVKHTKSLDIAISDTISVALKGAATPVLGQVIIRPPSRSRIELPEQSQYNGLTCLTLTEGCRDQFIARVEWLTGQHGMNLPNFSQGKIKSLIDAGKVKKLKDVFLLKPPDISLETLNIIQTTHLSLVQAIRALGIPAVGRKKSEWLADRGKNWKNIIQANPSTIRAWLKLSQKEADIAFTYLNSTDIQSLIKHLMPNK